VWGGKLTSLQQNSLIKVVIKTVYFPQIFVGIETEKYKEKLFTGKIINLPRFAIFFSSTLS
jgi:hypothetical protein